MPITTPAGSRAARARRLLSAGAIAAGLLGLAPVAPASAAGAPTPEQFAAMGNTHAPAYRLPRGCHWYGYDYRISPPEPEWALELLITDAAGVAQASDVVISGADPRSGSKRFQLCASNTAAPGLFTIRGRLTYKHYAALPVLDETRDHSGWITPSRFRVTKPAEHRPSATCVKARKKAKRLHTRKARRAAHRACHRR